MKTTAVLFYALLCFATVLSIYNNGNEYVIAGAVASVFTIPYLFIIYTYDNSKK